MSEAILKRANARRTPSQVTAYRIGDRVRVINQEYLAEKTNPRWSESLYRIRTVKGADSQTMQPEYILECDGPCSAKAQKLLKAPQGSNWRWFQHSQLMKVHGVVTKPPDVVDAPHTPDTDARPFDKNPSIADPRRTARVAHELEGKRIEVKWIFDDKDELVPATELNFQV